MSCPFFSRRRGAYVLLLIVLILALVVVGQTATTVEILSGNDQKASASAELPEPIQVVVKENKKPVSGRSVFFRLSDPISRVKAFPKSKVVQTDESGVASTYITLGFAPGEGHLLASLGSEGFADPSVEIAFNIESVHYFGSWFQIFFILAVSGASIAFAYVLSKWVLRKDQGTSAMREISDPIKEGAQGFFRTQYVTIAVLALPVALVLFVLYIMRASSTHGPDISYLTNAFLVSFSFLIGAACSGVAGLVGMWVAVRANIRVASAARRSYGEAVMIAIRSGAIAGFLVVALSVIGIVFLFMLLFGTISSYNISPHQIPVLLVGYGFGASFVALFAQLGGGIYTKAADVGADIIGKVEANIPEDDVRNPAVIADLVGDNVGDCAGRGADLFESIAAENIGAMILAGALAAKAAPQIENPVSYILFPLMVNIVGLVASWVGTFCVRILDRNDNLWQNIRRSYESGDLLMMRSNPSSRGPRRSSNRPLLSSDAAIDEEEEDDDEMLVEENDVESQAPAVDFLEDPMAALNRGFAVTAIIALIGFCFCCLFMLRDSRFPSAWFYFMICGTIGVATSWVFVFITIYYTDYKWYPVRRIAEASATGAGTNVIAGISVGLESTALPVMVISVAIVLAYWIGKASGIVDNDGNAIGGLFGTAVATLGMLSTSGYILAMDTFGPITDNAGGIVEMSQLPESVRTITDRLDAVGNTTKALTKGYAIGSASLAAFLLFTAFLDEVTEVTGIAFQVVDLAVPEVFVGALLGAGLVFLFSALAIRAVGKSAETVIMEVRRQFQEHPGIMEFKERPDYQRCVAIVTRSSLHQMVAPGLLAVLAPVMVGFIFKMIGYFANNVLLGAQASAGFLMVATITGILMALFFNNGGGAWDNAKKYIETGHLGGKGSEAHKAAVIGDTVGDPFKDTAGPSIHVLIKLLATITLVVGPMYVITSSAS